MSDSDLLPIVMIGGGGHAAVLTDILLEQQREIVAVISREETANRAVFSGIERLSSDEEIRQFDPRRVMLVNGIGMLPRSQLRQQINEMYLELGYVFESVISNSAVVSQYAKLEAGVQAFSGAIIQPGALVGSHTIVNTGAIVEHDCQVGTYNHIGPRATICGQVITESEVFIGAGATVIQNLIIEQGAIVAAGSTITRSVNQEMVVYPAKTSSQLNQSKGLS